MNKQLSQMVLYLWQVLQVLAVAIAIMTLVLVTMKVWGAFGLLP
jgi:hypothetical protein